MSISDLLKITEHLAYRAYGNDLVIVMDWKAKRTYLLRHRAAQIWLSIDSGRVLSTPESKEDQKIIHQLKHLFLLTDLASNNFHADYNFSDIQDDQHNRIKLVIDQWAASNYIPINGSFSVTGMCNLRCSHCYSVHQNSHMLNTDQIIRILDDLKANGNLALTLTGGEFFCRPDYKEILSYMCQNKFAVKINTNGNFINEKVLQDIESSLQLSHLHVSLYSSDPVVHDGITHVKGSYSKTINALNLLRQTDKNIRINCSVMKSNADSYKGVKNLIGDPMGIPVRYDCRLVPINNGDLSNLAERTDDKQVKDFYEWMLDDNIVDKESFLNPKRQTSADQIGLCSAGFSYFEVSEDGELHPCFQLRTPLGNLVDSTFADLWNESHFLVQLRKATQNTLYECKSCSLKATCNLCIGMSHLEDGNLFGKSTECCRDAKIRNQIAIERELISI